MTRRQMRGFLVGSALLILTACGRSQSSEPLVASGDGFEVSIGELAQVLQAMPGVPKGEVVGRRKQVLNDLVGQKLLAEAATSQKLDRNPAVMQQIEAARRVILAQAYAQSLTGDLVRPSPDEIDKFYNANQQLYAGRKIIDARILAVPVAAAKQPAVAAALKAKNITGLGAALSSAGAPGTPLIKKLRTDMPPFDDKPATAALRPGDTIVFSDPVDTYLLVVDGVTADPVNPGPEPIAARIMAKKQSTIISGEVDRLRAAHKVQINMRPLERPAIKLDDD